MSRNITNSENVNITSGTTINSTTSTLLTRSVLVGEQDNKTLSNIGIEEISLQPDKTLTVAVKAVSGNPTFVSSTLNTREDN